MILPRESFGAALGILRKSASADALNVLVLCACDADSLCCLHILTVWHFTFSHTLFPTSSPFSQLLLIPP